MEKKNKNVFGVPIFQYFTIEINLKQVDEDIFESLFISFYINKLQLKCAIKITAKHDLKVRSCLNLSTSQQFTFITL